MSGRARLAFVITCEHAGNGIPARYRACFAGQQAMLESHHGYDRGALQMAKDLARRFDAPLFHSTVSRLLVDLNRSPGHSRLHTGTVRNLPAAIRREICATYYEPFRAAAEAAITREIRRGKRVVHISSHSFTPVMNGDVRTADVGLLYDPARPGEVALCKEWRSRLAARDAGLRVRRNYPYTGKSDGFAAFLRKRHPAQHYIGIELEINQRFTQASRGAWLQLRRTLVSSLAEASEVLVFGKGGRDARRRRWAPGSAERGGPTKFQRDGGAASSRSGGKSRASST